MENKSSHILNASSNLLGFCLVIITSLKVMKFSHNTFIDEAAVAASLCLASSTLFSFLSLRTFNEKLEVKYEKVADYFFLTALLCIMVAILMFSTNFIN
ncbi:MAG: hypothetical protein BGO40_09890 [Chryseobacterium sp. 39-10]|nr:hypothetical protein [Chryseobacterium sp.]OJV49526.1 MAG: hypothetical protein BGO40_09890 [Chryseobacterium sp. 39-10]